MQVQAIDGKPLSAGGKLLKARAGGGGTAIDLGVTGAAVGDIIKVAAVDADGKPTAWEAAEMAGGELEFIQSFQLLSDTAQYELASVATYRRLRVNIIRPASSSSLGTGNMWIGLKRTDSQKTAYVQVVSSGYGNVFRLFGLGAGKAYVEATEIKAGNNNMTLAAGLGFGAFISASGDSGAAIRAVLDDIDKCVYIMQFAKPTECIDGEETVYVFGEKR